MCPMDHLRAERERNKQPIPGANIRSNRVNASLSDPLLDFPRDCPNRAGRGQDTAGRLGTVVWVEQTEQSVRFDIHGSGSLRQGKVKSIKEEGPPGLSGVVVRSLQPVTALLQCHFDCQEFTVAHIIVSFCRRESPGQKGAGVQFFCPPWTAERGPPQCTDLKHPPPPQIEG